MIPCRQAMSSSSSPAASPARSASRSSSAIIGSFRSPPGAARTNARNSEACTGLRPFGTAGPAGAANDPTNPASGTAVMPSSHAKRSSARTAFARTCADRGRMSRGDLGGQARDPGSGQDAELPGARVGERPRLAQVAGYRGRRQSALAGQPSPEPRQQHVHGLARHDGRGRRDGTEFPQVAQHRPERPVRPQMRQLSPADGRVLAGHLAAQPGQRHSLLREPAGQVPQQGDLRLAGPRRVPESAQPGHEPVRVLRQLRNSCSWFPTFHDLLLSTSLGWDEQIIIRQTLCRTMRRGHRPDQRRHRRQPRTSA